MEILKKFKVNNEYSMEEKFFLVREEAEKYMLEQKEIVKDNDPILDMFDEPIDTVKLTEGYSLISTDTMEKNLIEGLYCENFFEPEHHEEPTTYAYDMAVKAKETLEDIIAWLKSASDKDWVSVCQWDDVKAIGRIKEVSNEKIVITDSFVVSVVHGSMVNASHAMAARELEFVYDCIAEIKPSSYEEAVRFEDYEEKYERSNMLAKALSKNEKDVNIECYLVEDKEYRYGKYYYRYSIDNKNYLILKDTDIETIKNLNDKDFLISLDEEKSIEKTLVPNWNTEEKIDDYYIYEVA